MSAFAPQIQSVDASPKWYTEVQLDLRDGWVESTIQHLPTLEYDDTAFTRVQFEPLDPKVTPAPTARG